MEEGIGCPPGDGVQGINEVAFPRVLLSVIFARGVHPVFHLVQRIAGLVVAPIPVNQPAEPHRHGTEVVLERGVVRAGGGVLVDDDFRSVFGQPVVHFPCVSFVSGADQSGHLFFDTNSVRPNPLCQTHHAGLVHHVVVKAGPDVDSHGPDLLVLGVTVGVNFWIGIAVSTSATVAVAAWGATTAWPVDAGHVEIDVVGDFDVGIVTQHPLVRPVIAASFATLFSGP